MSNNNEIQPHYSCSFEELINKSIEKEGFLRRDIADLASRGVTTAKLDAMATERADFVAIPSNKTELESASKSISDRNKKAAEVVLALRKVINIAKDTFGAKSTNFKAFDVMHLSSLSPITLYTKSGNVVAKGNQNLVAMGLKGLTPAMLTSITTLAAELLPLIAATPVLATDAVLVTAERQTSANNVFDTMKAFCESGKSCYMDVNKIKYDNYVVYDTASKVVDRKGNVAIYGHKNPKTNGIKGDTKFNLRTTMGKSLIMYFSMLKGDAAPTGALEVLANPNIFVTKTAAQLGYDAAKGIIQMNIYNPNEGIGAFWVKIG